MNFKLKDKDFEMTLNVPFYDRNSVQKVLPVLAFPKVVNRIIEKAKEKKAINNEVNYLSLMRYNKYRGNPAEVLPEAKYCEGDNWKIIELTIYVKGKFSHLRENFFKVYYVQTFDSVNPFYDIELYEDEIENAMEYKRDHKKLYKVLNALKETRFYVGGLRRRFNK